jgi:signal transduction histidine kinase
LLASQDDERLRIACDLHDGTGQHLSGMALTIGQVLADFPPGHDQLRKPQTIDFTQAQEPYSRQIYEYHFFHIEHDARTRCIHLVSDLLKGRNQRSSTLKVLPLLNMTARSITFCSSRMFPGQP